MPVLGLPIQGPVYQHNRMQWVLTQIYLPLVIWVTINTNTSNRNTYLLLLQIHQNYISSFKSHSNYFEVHYNYFDIHQKFCNIYQTTLTITSTTLLLSRTTLMFTSTTDDTQQFYQICENRNQERSVGCSTKGRLQLKILLVFTTKA